MSESKTNVITGAIQAVKDLGLPTVLTLGIGYALFTMREAVWAAAMSNPYVAVIFGGSVLVVSGIWVFNKLQKQVVDGMAQGLAARDQRIARLEERESESQTKIEQLHRELIVTQTNFTNDYANLAIKVEAYVRKSEEK